MIDKVLKFYEFDVAAEKVDPKHPIIIIFYYFIAPW